MQSSFDFAPSGSVSSSLLAAVRAASAEALCKSTEAERSSQQGPCGKASLCIESIGALFVSRMMAVAQVSHCVIPPGNSRGRCLSSSSIPVCVKPFELQCVCFAAPKPESSQLDRGGEKKFSDDLMTKHVSKTSNVSSPSNNRRKACLYVRCSASEKAQTGQAESNNFIELPLFPLPLVLFPGAILPLQIFEFRYRMMMHTLLQTDLRFGVVYADQQGSGLAEVGCVGEVIKHERLVDDRFFLICKGQERFRIMDIVRTKPYLVAQVQWLEDRPSVEQQDLEALANEVENYMKDVIRLSNRLNGKAEKETPEDLRKKLFPTPFSFWVGSTFEGAPAEQQALLELEDTAQRLKREKETLRNTLNYLSAASAVKDAFPTSD